MGKGPVAFGREHVPLLRSGANAGWPPASPFTLHDLIDPPSLVREAPYQRLRMRRDVGVAPRIVAVLLGPPSHVAGELASRRFDGESIVLRVLCRPLTETVQLDLRTCEFKSFRHKRLQENRFGQRPTGPESRRTQFAQRV